MVRTIMQNVVHEDRTEYGWLGVVVQDLNDYLVRRYGYASINGVFVNGVVSDGPAQRAGLHVGDIVFEFAGTPISNCHDLSDMVTVTSPTTEATLTVFRGGETMSLNVTIGRFVDTRDASRDATSTPGTGMVAAPRPAVSEHVSEASRKTA
jgi:S1-C subfamily serine protease